MKRTLLVASLGLALAQTLSAAETASIFDIRNEAAFKDAVDTSAPLKKLATDMNFTEGPQWFNENGGYLIFSDIPANHLKKWTAKDGVTIFRENSQNANGNTIDLQGRLVSAEHSGRRVSVTEKDGTIKTLVDSFEGKKLNSPNDPVVKSDGTIYFTDPDYGLKNKPGTKEKEGKEQAGDYVFRFDPKTKTITALVKDFDKPNGLCFSPDEKKLYIADSGAPKHIRVFDVNADGTLSNGKVFGKIDKGGPDGIRCDKAGRVWSSAGDGVHIFAPSGELIGKILVPEGPANVGFGGKDLKTLFITARKSLYAIEVKAQGIK
jgi:gluconolactonase